MVPGSLADLLRHRRLFFQLLAIFLLTTAFLKVYGFAASSLPEVGWFSTPNVQAAAVLLEVLIGLWLLSGVTQNLSWLVSLTAFIGFSVVSGYLGLQGVASCGCLGAIKASPWILFVVDLIIVLGLIFARPKMSDIVGDLFLVNKSELLAIGCIGMVLSSVLFLYGYTRYGSFDCFIAQIRNQPIGAPQFVDFGDISPEQGYEAKIPISNFSDRPIRLIGGSADCNCITTSDMPITIEPNTKTEIKIFLGVRATSVGHLTKKVELWTDCDLQRKIFLTIGCNVLSGP